MHKNQYIDKKIPIITRIIGILWNIEVSNSGGFKIVVHCKAIYKNDAIYDAKRVMKIYIDIISMIRYYSYI